MTELRQLSDRIHPIVVRDIKVALRGRIYGLTMGASCIAVLAIAMLSVQRDHESLELSRWILVMSIGCLVPILMFLIPVQSFLSLRDEASSQTADQLVLTNLRPMSVIMGMLQVALLQAVLFLAVFAPLIGFSYLLLAVDAYTLLQILWLLLFGCAASTGLAFASMYLARWSFLREHLTLIVMFVIGLPALGILGEIDGILLWLESVSRSEHFWLEAARQISFLILLTTAFCLVGASRLTNFQENRAIVFRVLGLVAAPTLTLLAGGGLASTPMAAALTAPFWGLVVCDSLEFERRQRVLVPVTKAQAIRMFILLPGSARGWLYSWVLAGVVFATGLSSQIAITGGLPKLDELAHGLAGAGYIVLVAGAFAYARNHMIDQNRLATVAARSRLPATMLFFAMIHAVIESIISVALGLEHFITAPINPMVAFTDFGHSMPHTVLWQIAMFVVIWRLNRQDVRASWTEVMAIADRERRRDLESEITTELG